MFDWLLIYFVDVCWMSTASTLPLRMLYKHLGVVHIKQTHFYILIIQLTNGRQIYFSRQRLSSLKPTADFHLVSLKLAVCIRLYAGDTWCEVHGFNKNIAVNFNLNVFLTSIDTMLIYSDTFGICQYFHSQDDIGELLLSKILRSTKSSVHCSPIWNGCWQTPMKLINSEVYKLFFILDLRFSHWC